jgi:hypothetical protein
MTRFKALDEFESRFASMGVPELERWREYWVQHAQLLAPKVRKEALRRVHKIDKAIRARQSA